MNAPQITLTHKSGTKAVVTLDEDGMIVGLPEGAEGLLVGTQFLEDAKAYRAAIVAAQSAAIRSARRAEARAALRPVLGYRVCTFGTPGPSRGHGYGPHEGGLYRVRAGAVSAAESSVGSGSCTNARVAVIYDVDADPDISEGGGEGWEWLSHREMLEADAR